MTSASNDNSKNAVVHCAVCSKPVVADYAPFCSKRCADIDLHRWLSGAYAVPGEEETLRLSAS
ncbi:MAG: DNA gyrase inhibitor YacG [Parvularculaceae bacterium]